MKARISVAITGASGFIGRHLIREFLSEDVDLLVLTRNREQFEISHPKMTILAGDICAPSTELVQTLAHCDTLVHLAWNGLPNYSSLHHFETELPLQYRFLQRVVAAGVKNLVVAGTCFEYGMQSGALSETMPTHPSNPYGFAKDVLRKQLEFLQMKKPFNLVWARLFYLYGDGQAATSLFSQLNTAVRTGQKTFNMSGGEQLRDFLPVGEASRIIALLVSHQKNFGIVNVCSGTARSVREMVEDWLQKNNWTMALNLGHYPYPDYEPMAFWGDNAKLLSLLSEAASPILKCSF